MKDYVELHDGILVSLEDADIRVCKLGSEKYPYFTRNLKKIMLHREVMRRILLVELPKHLVVDHINNNRLDNRRENLQLVTPRYNRTKDTKGTSKKYRVTYNERYKLYYVRIYITGIGNNHFGAYADEEEAAFWADVWAYRILNETDTILNFPERIAEIEAEALKIDNDNWKWQRKTFYAYNHANVLGITQL